MIRLSDTENALLYHRFCSRVMVGTLSRRSLFLRGLRSQFGSRRCIPAVFLLNIIESCIWNHLEGGPLNAETNEHGSFRQMNEIPIYLSTKVDQKRHYNSPRGGVEGYHVKTMAPFTRSDQ